MSRLRFWIFAAIVLAHVGQAAACEATLRATVPLAPAHGVWTVTATVDGQPARFVLDTGAERTVLALDAIDRLRLARDKWISTMMRGVGGVVWLANGVMRSFDLGGIPLRRRAVNQSLTFPVSPLPWSDAGGEPIAGLLGADYLSPFDLELDPWAQTLSLYAMRDCADGPVPWTEPHEQIRAVRARPLVLLVPVRVNGIELKAQLDTGASASLITLRGAARLGLDAAAGTPGATARGIGPQSMALRLHRFEEVRFGPLVRRGLDLPVGAPAGGYPFDMLLGRDLLQGARVWISYATDSVLVALPSPAPPPLPSPR